MKTFHSLEQIQVTILKGKTKFNGNGLEALGMLAGILKTSPTDSTQVISIHINGRERVY